MRPDVTVVLERPDGKRQAMVVEIKRTQSDSYLAQGYGEALLYRHEYGESLIEWPKAVLVGEADIPGALRKTDEVIACGWRAWAPEEVCAALLAFGEWGNESDENAIEWCSSWCSDDQLHRHSVGSHVASSPPASTAGVPALR